MRTRHITLSSSRGPAYDPVREAPRDAACVPSHDTVLVLHVPQSGMPSVVYLDRRPHAAGALPSLAHADVALTGAPQPMNATLEVGNPSLVPTQSEGWTGAPKLSVCRGGVETFVRLEPSEITDDGAHCRIVAQDRSAGVQLGVAIDLEPGGLVRERLSVTNLNADPLEVRALMASMPVPPGCETVEYCTGHHLRERHLERHRFTRGLHAKESRMGRPDFDAATLMSVGTDGFGWEHGRVCSAHVAWSGNSVQFAERTPYAHGLIGGGEALAAGEVVLGRGETYESPDLLVALGEGRNEVAAQFHDHVRAAHPELRRRARPVTLNTWEAVYFDQDERRLGELAKVAASLGVERFVIDDGWFRARRDDARGLGDWSVDRTIWPRGLAPIADLVHGLGMEFGLWFEPEMVNPDSDLARAHPDWMLAPNADRLPLPGRHQQVLDLTREEVRQHIYDAMDGIVTACGVDYIKWDHNRFVTEAVSPADGRPAVHRQTAAVYAIIDALHRRHPGLEIESCASGGGRIDCGMLSRVERVWASDCTDPIERADIQRGISLIVPHAMIGEHISASPNHATRRTTTLATRAAMAFFGHLGVEWNLLDVPERDRAELRTWISLYREHRDWVAAGRLVHADHADPSVRVDGVVSADRSRAIFRFAALASSASYPIGRITLPGLASQALYRVRPLGGRSRYDDELSPSALGPLGWWSDGGALAEGGMLGRWGLCPPQLAPEHAVLVECVRLTEQEVASLSD